MTTGMLEMAQTSAPIIVNIKVKNYLNYSHIRRPIADSLSIDN
jgi:hypothetical protein